MTQAHRDAGQAAVETAMVMPLTVFLILGTLQLAALQQARITTEYAAFQAARAGIVWSGNNERMHDAALWALLPTLGRTDGMAALGRTWARAVELDAALHQALLPGLEGKLPAVFLDAGLLGMVRVDTLNPTDDPRLGQLWNLSGGERWEELDLDGPDSLPQSNGLDPHLARFYDPRLSDAQQELYRRATVLTVRVRYLYELQVPFASWILFTAWYATNAGHSLQGGIDRPRLERGSLLTGAQSLDPLAGEARGIVHRRGLATATPREMQLLWALAHGGLALGQGGRARRFFLPLTATSSLRMQSNFHRKWLMHEEPEGSP